MSAPLADAKARQRALDPGASFIVQAPAGSGKTALLIQRLLVLLATVQEPESVVAITFTRKAAGEMRSRLLQALADASEAEPAESFRKETWKLAQAVLRQDQACGWNLLRNPNRLRIQTIDSFCATLVTRMPWLARLGAPLRTTDDPEPLYREAARATLRLLEGGELRPGTLASNIATLLLHLDNNVGFAEELLVNMLARRDQWLRHIIGEDPSSLRELLETAMQSCIEDELLRAQAHLPSAEDCRELLALLRFAGKNLGQLPKLHSGMELVAACSSLPQLPPPRWEALDDWLAISHLLLVKAGTVRRSLTVNCGFPKEEKNWKQRFLGLVDRLDAEFTASLEALRVLPAAHFPEEQWQVLRALLEVLRRAVAELQLVFQSSGIADFSEIAVRACTALSDQAAPSQLAYSLDGRIQHLLVDEFQDTSYSQYQLLRALTSEWAPGDGRTLFLVGDPMQSIYRFREANVALFLKTRREGLGNLPLQSLQLTVNFRSQPALLAWFNQQFPKVFPCQEDLSTGAVAFTPCAVPPGPTGENGPAVEIHTFLDGRNAAGADEAATILSVVGQERAKRAAASIAILVRSRAHARAAIEVLSANGIPVQAVAMDSLESRPVVRDLTALTRALLHSLDNVAWMAVLRAPWCGFTLADLLLLGARARNSSIWSELQDAQLPGRLSPPVRPALTRLLKSFAAVFELRDRLPLALAVERLWCRLGGPACVAENELPDARTFLDLLRELASGWSLDLGNLQRRLEKLFASPLPAENPVQVMTVHNAKGLEFDVVLLPGLGRKPRNDEKPLLIWEESSAAHRLEPRLLLSPIHPKGATSDKTFDYLWRRRAQGQELEAGRLLYVAATRARHALHLFASARVNSQGEVVVHARSHAERLWDLLQPHFQLQLKAASQSAAMASDERIAAQSTPGIVRTRPLVRLAAHWQAPPVRGAIAWHLPPPAPSTAAPITFDWAGELLRQVGSAVHQILHAWTRSQQFALDSAQITAALHTQGVLPAEMEEAVRRTRAALEGVLADERGRWILKARPQHASELALTAVLDGQLRKAVLDRSFVEDNVCWVIDYKTSTHQGAGLQAFLENEARRYAPQLATYAAIMQLRQRFPVRTALYFPLLGAWIELPVPMAAGAQAAEASNSPA